MIRVGGAGDGLDAGRGMEGTEADGGGIAGAPGPERCSAGGIG